MNKWKNRCLSAAWQQEHRSGRAFQVLWDFMQNISSTLCHSSMNCKNLKVRTKEFILSSILHGPVMRSWHLPCKIQESYAVPNSTATEVSKKNLSVWSLGLYRDLTAFAFTCLSVFTMEKHPFPCSIYFMSLSNLKTYFHYFVYMMLNFFSLHASMF